MEKLKFDSRPLNQKLLFKTPQGRDLQGSGQNLTLYYLDQTVMDVRLNLKLDYAGFERVLQGALFNLKAEALKPAERGLNKVKAGLAVELDLRPDPKFNTTPENREQTLQRVAEALRNNPLTAEDATLQET